MIDAFEKVNVVEKKIKLHIQNDLKVSNSVLTDANLYY